MKKWLLAFMSALTLLCAGNAQTFYYHSHTATQVELDRIENHNLIFEIDLSWAENAFHPCVKPDHPFIGHPEAFYTVENHPFPIKNVSITTFIAYCLSHPEMKVLLDVKDVRVLPLLEEIFQGLGPERCIVHAFIAEWKTHSEHKAHWDQELIPIKPLDALLTAYGVPMIANCNAHSEAHVKQTDLVKMITEDARNYRSIAAIGLYYIKATLPSLPFLEQINRAGYLAWVNGNEPNVREKLQHIRYIAMCDEMSECYLK